MNQKLKSVLETGIPLVGAALAIFGSEVTGLSQHIQNYQFEKVALVKEYFGGPLSQLQQGVAYISRGVVDVTASIIGLQTGRVSDFFIERHYMKKMDKRIKPQETS